MYILDILKGLGLSYVMPDFAVFCCELQNYSKPYRTLPRFNSMNRYSVIVVANQRYCLKRCSGMLGSILDLKLLAVWGSDLGGGNTVRPPGNIQI